MTRYSLSYETGMRGRITLYNLLRSAVDEIKRAQAHLGSHNFEVRDQPHNFSDEEIRLIESDDLR